jgi:predicted secreted hydrolase
MVMTMTTGIVNKLTRRRLLLGSQPALLGLPGLLTSLGLGTTRSAHAMTEGELEFPRDHGAHPDFRTEWWYITGQAFKAGKGVDAAGEPDFGFQLTFFRSRVESTQGMVSNFAAKQLIFAHAAITDVKGKKLVSDQRVGFGERQQTHHSRGAARLVTQTHAR